MPQNLFLKYLNMKRKVNPGTLILFIALSTGAVRAQQDTTNIPTIGSEAFQVLRQFYDYDKVVPLDVNVVEQINWRSYDREKIIFRGQHGQVPGYFATPKSGNAPYPIIILLHGVTSSKESWWEENSSMGQLAEQLLASGYAVLTIDAEYHGERAENSPFESPIDLLDKEWFVHFRDMMIESVIDHRRGLDYLASRGDIDMSKIGLVGYSMGGVMTFILSAVDERINVALSCVSPIVSVPYLPTAVQNFAPFTEETPFLMLMGTNDERNYTTASANLIYHMITSKKKI